MSASLKNSYLAFIERRHHGLIGRVGFLFLVFLSYVYAAALALINFCYDKNILFIHRLAKPVISLGNISWGGSGKSTLVLKLYQCLKGDFNVAILRRGYGEDEGAMLEHQAGNIHTGKDRAALARALEGRYDCFFLDDGFQHRKLFRDCNIVVMAAREFNHAFYLIPAYIFREPLSSLKRADLVVINYKSELKSVLDTKIAIEKYTRAPVFFADYKMTIIKDLAGRIYPLQDIVRLKVAAVTAIGYPQGFFNKLRVYGAEDFEEIVYPDHHELSVDEAQQLSILLAKKAITHIIITMKDRNRFDGLAANITVLVAEIEMIIDNEEDFMRRVRSFIKKS